MIYALKSRSYLWKIKKKSDGLFIIKGEYPYGFGKYRYSSL